MSDRDSHRVTRPLSAQEREVANQETGPLFPVQPTMQPRITRLLPMPSGQLPLLTDHSATRIPTVIPVEKPRPRPSANLPHRRHRFVFPAVVFSMVFIFGLGGLLVVPLDGGQSQSSIAQGLTSWITHVQSNALTTSQQLEPPTATPALRTGEGSCGGSDIWGTCATAITASGHMGTGTMQRPIKGATITQVFANPEYQIWCGCTRPHTGIDLAASYGTPVTAADDGQVIWAGWEWSGLGWAIKINHGHYIATIYGHMKGFIVKVGQNVTKGQIVGYEGSTGASTGPHLHFMVMVNNTWVNPMLFMALP